MTTFLFTCRFQGEKEVEESPGQLHKVPSQSDQHVRSWQLQELFQVAMGFTNGEVQTFHLHQ